MFKTYFNDTQLITLIGGIILFLASLFFQVKEKYRLSIAFLLLSAFLVFCFAALLDPFLNLWDERFHALVARNMMDHPFKPTLYDDPVVNTPYNQWDKFHIWLHKQPLFLWQIALSFRLFGANEFTLRLPSVILGVALVFSTYRVGKLLVNERTGYLAGVLIVSSFNILELIAGRQMLDHNDVSFLVYISLSIWAFVEYYHSGKKRWIYLVGLFSGLAILCKWLVGLLVYAGWFLLKLKQKKYRLHDLKDMLISLAITICVALPWQIYTLATYPEQTRMAYRFNVQHFLIPLDSHSGSFFYHLQIFNELYGTLGAFLVIPGFIILYKRMRDKNLFIPLTGMVLLTYLFFSFAQTRMPSFTIIVCSLIFISFAALLDYLLEFIKKLKLPARAVIFLAGMVIIVVFFMNINIDKLQATHTLWKKDNTYSRMLMHNREVFKSLHLPGNTVIFNVKGQHYIELMFYSGLPSYRFIPSEEQYRDVKDKGRTVAIFRPSNGVLPDYIMEDKSVIILEQQLQGYN